MKNNNYLNGYFSLKNEAVIELKGHLLRTYTYIVSKDYKGEGMYYSQSTMALELNISVRTLQRHIRALKELGYLTVKRRGFNMTNLYTIAKGVIKKVKETKEELALNFKKQFKPSKSKSNKLKFNNFTGRNYSKEDLDKLENQLLGWE